MRPGTSGLTYPIKLLMDCLILQAGPTVSEGPTASAQVERFGVTL